MKRILPIALVICTFFVIGVAGAAGPVTLKFGIHDPMQANVMTGAYIPWIESMNGRAPDDLKIDIYAGAVLGRDPRTYLKLLNDGVQDITFILGAFNPGRFPDDEVFSMPFMANNGIEGSQAAWNMYHKGLLRGYEDLYPLSIGTTDVYRIHSNFPIRRPGDLKGKKIRVSGKLQVKLFESLGAIPVSMPIQTVAENMTRGVVDGVLCDTNALYVFRINEVANYYLKTPPMGVSCFSVPMTQKKFDSLSPRAQMIIKAYRGMPLLLPLANVMTGESDKWIAEAEKNPKKTVYTPTAEEQKEWKAAIQPVIDEWIKNTPNGEKLLEAFQKELDWIQSGGYGKAP